MEKALRKEALKQKLNVNITVDVLRGATVESATPIIEKSLKNNHYDQVYFAIGVNDLTDKHLSGRVTGSFSEPSNLIEILEMRLDKAKTTLNKYTSKFVICHVIGVDIATYNNEPTSKDYCDMQKVIDQGLPLLNIAINSMNIASNIVGPWLSDTVHSNINGRYICKYKRLPDGLHPDSKTCELWAKKYIKAISDNM